jgi:YVTN family beta-propeller protein
MHSVFTLCAPRTRVSNQLSDALPPAALRKRNFWLTPMLILAAFSALVAAPARGQSVTATPAEGDEPHAVAVNPVTNKIYIANLDGTLTVIDGATNAVSNVFYNGTEGWAVAVNPVTNYVFVADRGAGLVDVFTGAVGSTPAQFVETVTPATQNNLFSIAVNPLTNTVYVCDDGGGTVTAIVFNGSSYQTTAIPLPGIATPDSVAIDPVHNMIYVGDDSGNQVWVINGATNTLATLPNSHPNPIAVGSAPESLAVNPATNMIYVANLNSNNVSVINGATGLVTATLSDPSASGPAAVFVNPETNQIYVANLSSSNTTVINGATNVVTDVPTNAGTSSIGPSVAVDTATNIAYIANNGNGSVTWVNGNGAPPYTTGTLTTQAGNREIAVNPVTHKVYAAGYSSSTVTVLDGATNTSTSPAYPQPQPWSVAVNPVTNTIFVANNASNTVSVIDGSTNTLDPASPVTVGNSPNALAVDPINNLIYVSNYNSSSVSVINGASLTSTPSTIMLQNGVANNFTVMPNLLSFNPVLNQVFGASTSQGVGFTFPGGAGSQTITANSFFGGANVTAIGTNPAQGDIFATFSDTNALQVSDVHGGFAFGVCAAPTAADVNAATNVIYVACTNANQSSVSVVSQADAFTPGTVVTVPLPNSPYPAQPSAVAANPLTNMVYVTDSFNSVLFILNGANNSVSSLNLSAFGLQFNPSVCKIPVSEALNIASNKIYVLCAGDSNDVAMLVAIDGATNTFLAAVQVSPYGNVNNQINEVAANPVTGNIYGLAYFDNFPVTVMTENTLLTNPLQTCISLAPNADNSGNTTVSVSPVFTFSATTTTCSSTTPVAGIYFQVDSQQGTWTPVSPGPNAFTGTASGLAPGFHIMYAYAADGQFATSENSGAYSEQDGPVVGTIASYGFLVAPPIATVNAAPITNPMNFGTVPVGSASPSPNPILINNGGAASSLSYSFQITGTDSGEFVVDPTQSSCIASGGTLASNTSCEIYVSFQPTATGPATAMLTWTDNSLGVSNSTQVVYFSGNGSSTNVPTPTIGESAANPSYISSNIFAWSDTDNSVTSYLCAFTSGSTPPPAPTNYSPCTSPTTVSNLQENTWYAYAIEAVDNQGNVSQPFVDTWQVIPSAVNLTINGTGTGTVVSTSPTGLNCSASCTVPFNGVLVTLVATPTGNSTFAGWSNTITDPNSQCPLGGNPTACALQTGDSNQPVTATFNSNVASYSVTVNELGTGTGTVSDGGNLVCSEASGIESGNCSNTYPSPGPSVVLTATATAPSTFVGWGGGACTAANSSVTPSGGTCGLNLISNVNVTANFLPAPTTVTVTFPVSPVPITETATYNCPGNPNPTPANPCTLAQGPSATSLSLTAQAVSTSFQVSITSTEVPPTMADGICESNNDTPTGVSGVNADFDCRFLQFFNYGTDPTTSGAIVPLCVPYSNGNCVHYEVSSPGGGEPDSSMYLGPINWVLTWNDDSVTPSGPYWTNSTPQLYDDPDYPVFSTSPFGTDCTVAMSVNSGPAPTFACQFEFDITTFFDPNQPVDAGIGGTTRQFNDVVVAWPPTSVPNNGTLPLLNGNSTTSPANGSTTFGNSVGFNITLTNNGTTTASGITLNDPLPPGATWSLSSSSVNGCGISGGVNSQTLSCPAFSLAPAATATFSVSSSNAAAGVYANTATFTIGTQQTLAVATVTVQGLTPSFSGLSSNTISFGTASVNLSGSVGLGGAYPAAGDTVQITINGTTQSASIAGTSGGFSYSFPTATIPASSTPYTVTYKFLGDSNFTSVTNNSTTLTVNKANQSINFTTNAPTSASYGSTFTVVAAATSGIAVSYTNSGSCSNSGAMYTITSGSGTCNVIANQSGNSNYNAAPTVTQMTSATKATSSTTISSNTPNPSNVGQTVTVGFKVTGAGTPTGSVTVTAKLSSTTVTCSGTLSSGAGSCGVVLSTAGAWTLTASYGGDGNFNTSSTSSGTPQTVNAAGSTLKFSPSALNFGTVYVGNTDVQLLTVTNTGSSMVTFTNFSIGSISGDDSTGFLGVEFCPKTLNPGKSCPIIMSFTADSNVTKTHAANLVIADNASGSPQMILMSATVINPVASLSASSLSFGNQKTGTTSAAKPVTLKNTGTTTLTLTGLSISGNFAFTTGTTCTKTTSLTAGGTCMMEVAFTPASKGSKSGSITITNNAKNSPQSISLSGAGN